ncbi:MAG: YfbU family protein [Bacteroidetes bacterium]|nr:YfbU family protein [Chitinophagales bacterium]MBS1732655.1 YfbU family protein [Bacteroidota bacterium]
MDTLTIFERATLANQFKILSFLDTANTESHLTDAEIFENGYTGLYSEALQHINSEETSREVCTETHDILTMFRYISNAIDRLTAAEKAALDLNKIKFDGFDANNDDHYHFATFMIEKQEKYTEYSERDINSHSMASMIRYRRMLPVYKSILANHIYDFGVNELQQLIDVA